jgi:hypothetical protein
MLVYVNGNYVTRCFTSTRYERIWNHKIVGHLQNLQAEDGWRVPPARPAGVEGERTRKATEADCLSRRVPLGVQPGDTVAPAGLYASDRDMFVFMIDDDHTITNPLDKDSPLARGFFLWNSEVGDKSFGLTTFLYDGVCGNHIVWGAQEVTELRLRHVGRAPTHAFGQMRMSLRRYSQSSARATQDVLNRASEYELGETKEEVLEYLFKYISRRALPLPKGTVTEAYDVADATPRYNPRTPLGIVGGLTEINQKQAHASQRVERDRAASKLLEIVF